LTYLKQASIDKEVDGQIASVLLISVGDDDDDDVDYDVHGAAFSLSSSWLTTVDQTASSSLGSVQPYFQWPVNSTTLSATARPSASTDGVSSTAVPRRRRTRQPHTKAAVGVMKAWYDEHRSRPYASDAEVRRLAMQCQLGVRQVQKWLSNRRRMDGNTRRRNRPAHNATSSDVLPPTQF